MEDVKDFLRITGSGYGYGHGSGYGSGYGYGDGSGDGDGSGSGSGTGSRFLINGNTIYDIDNVATILYSVKDNIAKGAIVNNDLTSTKCFVIKRNNLFAHGESIKKAMEALEEKLFNNMDVEERIEAFWKNFKIGKKYSAMKFFEWHNKLTNSCEIGRTAFANNHGINLGDDEFTVQEFINLTKRDFGGSIIKKLEDSINS